MVVSVERQSIKNQLSSSRQIETRVEAVSLLVETPSLMSSPIEILQSSSNKKQSLFVVFPTVRKHLKKRRHLFPVKRIPTWKANSDFNTLCFEGTGTEEKQESSNMVLIVLCDARPQIIYSV